MYGTTNALISNMITGVSKGYEKGLVQIRDFARPPQVENHLNAEAGLLTCFRSSGLPTIH